MDPGLRAFILTDISKKLGFPPDIFGPALSVATLGVDHVGRYELLFSQLRAEMGDLTPKWPDILKISDAKHRAAMIAADTPPGHQIDAAFDRAMDITTLVRLFGAAATQNSFEPFSRHFARRTRLAIETMDSENNPYLWQMLTGHYPETAAAPWLGMPAPARMPQIEYVEGSFDDALRRHTNHFDFVFLSNILDWLSEAQAKRTLELAHNAPSPRRHGLAPPA